MKRWLYEMRWRLIYSRRCYQEALDCLHWATMELHNEESRAAHERSTQMTRTRHDHDEYPEGQTSSSQWWDAQSKGLDKETVFDALMDADMLDEAFAVLDGKLTLAEGVALIPRKAPRELTPEEIEKMLGM